MHAAATHAVSQVCQDAASDPLKQDCSPSEQGTPPEPAIPRDEFSPYDPLSCQLDEVHFDMIVTESLTPGRLECVIVIDSTSMLSTRSG